MYVLKRLYRINHVFFVQTIYQDVITGQQL